MGLTLSGEFNDVLENAYVSGQITVGATAVVAKVGASNLSGREVLRIYNKSNNTIYFGASGVTVATGEPIFKNQWIELNVGSTINIFLIAGNAGNNVVIHEFA